MRNPYDAVPGCIRNLSSGIDESIDTMTDSKAMNRMVTGIVEAPGRWDDRIAPRIEGGENSNGTSRGLRGMTINPDVLSVKRSAVRASRPTMINREWVFRVAAFKSRRAGKRRRAFATAQRA